MEFHMNSSPSTPTSNRANNDEKQNSALAPPIVHGAIYDEDHQGLLPVSTLTDHILVELVAWKEVRAGDSYQLLLNGAHTGPIRVIDAEQAGDPLFLPLSTYYLRIEGVYTLAYQAVAVEHGIPSESDPVRVEIDLTPPGQPQLQPIKFPAAVEGGLTWAELTAMGDQLVAEVSRYTDMYQHDVIRTFWGDIEGPSVVVSRSDVELGRVQVICSREFLESLGDFNGSVTYTAMDRAGNISPPSVGIQLQVSVTLPENFPAPLIDPALGTLIDYAEACQGVMVDIPRYPGATAGDQITLYWQGIASAPLLVSAGHEHKAALATFIVPYQTSAANPQGVAHVRYEVKRDGQLFGISLQSSIDVLVSWPGPSDLAAPVIQGTSTNANTLDNFIDEDDYELDGRAVIQWNNGFVLGDELGLHWGDESIVQWYQVTASDISAQQDLLIAVPQTIMKTGGSGSQIPVLYTLTRLGNPNPSKSPVQRVIVRCKEKPFCGCHCPVTYSNTKMDITARL